MTEDLRVTRIEKNIVIATIGIILLVTAIMMMLSISSRIGLIEDQLTYEGPGQFEAPDLSTRLDSDVDRSTASRQGRIYVPIYSHIYHHDGKPYPLAATLSVRNTDTTADLHIASVRYYDTRGTLSRTDIDQPVKLGPMETVEFFVRSEDFSGGSGANFLVEWFALTPGSPPLIEAVMVGTAGTQGVCFSRSGIELGN